MPPRPPRIIVSDEQFLVAVLGGDATAFTLLTARYTLVVVVTIADILVEDPGVAEVAVQDVFLAVWRHAATFQPGGSIRRWIWVIAHHVATDIARHRAVRRRHELPLGAAVQVMTGTALTALPTAQRHAIFLVCFAGLSHPEIAARMGVPLGMVKGRPRLGLRHLRGLRLAPPAGAPSPNRPSSLSSHGHWPHTDASARATKPRVCRTLGETEP